MPHSLTHSLYGLTRSVLFWPNIHPFIHSFNWLNSVCNTNNRIHIVKHSHNFFMQTCTRMNIELKHMLKWQRNMRARAPCNHFGLHRSIEKTNNLFIFSFLMVDNGEKSRAHNRFQMVSLSFVLIGVIIGLKTTFFFAVARSCWAPGQHNKRNMILYRISLLCEQQTSDASFDYHVHEALHSPNRHCICQKRQLELMPT